MGDLELNLGLLLGKQEKESGELQVGVGGKKGSVRVKEQEIEFGEAQGDVDKKGSVRVTECSTSLEISLILSGLPFGKQAKESGEPHRSEDGDNGGEGSIRRKECSTSLCVSTIIFDSSLDGVMSLFSLEEVTNSSTISKLSS